MKKNIALLFGGTGFEDEISIISAKAIFENLNKLKYNIFLIFMNHSSDFIYIDSQNKDVFHFIKSKSDYDLSGFDHEIINFVKFGFMTKSQFIKIDSVFNIIHGAPGETGEISGFFDILRIKYIGSNLKSSSVLMDKEFSNILSIPSSNVLDFERASKKSIKSFEYYQEKYNLPFFLKASNAGSSRGVFKIESKPQFENSIKDIFNFDSKIIIQKGLNYPREIEIAAFFFINQNGEKELKIADIFGEIRPSKKHGFYSYDAKYNDEDGAELIIKPALKDNTRNQLLKATKDLFELFDCSFGRIDFLVDENENIFFNEINTIPGFTSISMFPKLFLASGIKFDELLDFLIDYSFCENK